MPTSKRSATAPESGAFFDGVDAVWIEGDVVLDGPDRGVRRFISPDGVRGALATGRDAEVVAVAFVRAVRRVLGSREQRQIYVLARDVLHPRIRRFLQSQRRARVGDDLSETGYRQNISLLDPNI